MRLLIIRHGDPDYARDSLTDTGWTEAELLADRLVKEDITEFYVSPLGRARDTAAPTLRRLGREAEILPWLREFPADFYDPELGRQRVLWDWLPGTWTAEPRYFGPDTWLDTPFMREHQVRPVYEEVCSALDHLLAEHGYLRQGRLYRAERPNRDTLALICHFGLECVLLSHLLGISPMALWHGTCAAPASVTTLCTEERRQGVAYFRMSGFGDVSHLYAAGQAPSFSARFCETFDCAEERHD